MVNEHHNAAFCTQARISIMSSMLAQATKRAKIVQLGNPLPTWDNPVQLAEETSMIDMISQGRLVAGIVRGGGVEQIANNVNPAYNRERFQEAHDLLIKAWTVPGPWRWDGEHYQVRVVNPWATPLQKPHPRVWVPGISSKETIEFAARHGYPFVCLNTTLEDTQRIWAHYDKIADDLGYDAGPAYRGYLIRVYVAETEAEAVEAARHFMWMAGSFSGYGRQVWTAPAGYSSIEARRSRASLDASQSQFEAQRQSKRLIVGTVDQVIDDLRYWMENTRPGLLMLWGQDGPMSHQQAANNIRLMGEKVLPAVRDIARKLGLHDPFELDTPVSLAASKRRAAA
jgi:alkanesulfonate monooxygenase SsuD/methylene tetrahydromethanopterin reductase-like flavin-dependent oxidoreductase (luciferase family)